MASSALCFKCGSFKRNFDDRCSTCGFEPVEALDMAKSRILGKPWSFTYTNEGDVVDTGRSRKELEEISAQIRSGVEYSFPEPELKGVLAAYMQAQSTTPAQLGIAVVKWLSPVMLVIGLLIVYFIFGR